MADLTPSRILNTVRNSSPSRRFVMLGGAAVVVVGLWAVGNWAISPAFVTLYGDLALGDAAKITAQLDQEGIPNRLDGGGTAVSVPASQMARARVALAQEGLPLSGRPGLELFDQPSWGMTDFTQRVTYQRALEGELARTISGIRGIRAAQVHLAIPSAAALRRTEQSVGASVVLTVEPAAALSSEAVQGITYIVSNSVERLTAENVAVMDDQGRVLSTPGTSESMAGLTSRQLELQRSVEEHLVNKLETMLTSVLGQGRARTEVAADLNFQQVDRTIEAYDPEGQVVQSEQRSETDAGTGPIASGAQTITNNTYQNSRTVERIVDAVGGIQRLTVAVLVDEAWLSSVPLADQPTRLADVEAMVRDAAGVDDARGDRVSVVAISFDTTLPPGLTPAVGAADDQPGFDILAIVERIGRPVVALVAVAALLVLAWRALAVGALPGPAALPALGAPAMPSSAPATSASATPPPDVDAVRARIQAESQERPEVTAQIIRSWLAEGS